MGALNTLIDLVASIYFWLTILLVLGIVVVGYIIRRGERVPEGNEVPVRKQPRVFRRSRSLGGGGGFAEKLGEVVVRYLIDISRAPDKKTVQDRIKKIIAECEHLNTMSIPEENKKIISTVLWWANHFNVEKHVAEMTLYRRSTQIQYDPQKRDFKLLIVEEK